MPMPPMGGAVLERTEEVLVELHGLRIAVRGQQRLLDEPLVLDHGVDELGVGDAELDAVTTRSHFSVSGTVRAGEGRRTG